MKKSKKRTTSERLDAPMSLRTKVNYYGEHELRNKGMIEMINTGSTYASVAREYGLSVSRVQQVYLRYWRLVKIHGAPDQSEEFEIK